MSTSYFLQEDNVELLWEVILDAELVSSDNNTQLRNYFLNNLKNFYEREKLIPQNLTTMNKKLISTIIYNFNKEPKQPELELNNSLLTVEALHAERKTVFDNTLAQKRQEFDSAMSIHIPDTPNFNDKKDEPIGAMEELIARTLAQRNFEIDQIHQNTNNKAEANSWLSGKETSIKPKPKAIQGQPQEQRQIKYIKIGVELDAPHVIDLNKKKQISWVNDDIVIEEKKYDTGTNNIFSKLKVADDYSSFKKEIMELLVEHLSEYKKEIVDLKSRFF